MASRLGFDPQQIQSVVSQSTSLLSTGNFIQRVELNNLDPSQRYVYRIRKNNYNSHFFAFKTDETNDAESATVLVATSDMQKDNANPHMFEKVVNEGLFHFSLDLSEINEHIDFLSSWRFGR